MSKNQCEKKYFVKIDTFNFFYFVNNLLFINFLHNYVLLSMTHFLPEIFQFNQVSLLILKEKNDRPRLLRAKIGS